MAMQPRAGKCSRNVQFAILWSPARIGWALACRRGRSKSWLRAQLRLLAGHEAGGLVWSPETLDPYLTDPQKVVPGNKMPFPGLKTDSDRADVIALLSNAGGIPQPGPAASKSAGPNPEVAYLPDAKYTLHTGIAEGRLVFIGVGGDIDGKVNPVLSAAEGQVVQLTLINGEGAEHDIVFPDQDAKSPRVTGKGASTTLAFRAQSRRFHLFLQCSWAPGGGHARPIYRHAEAPGPAVVEADISRDPTDLPSPIGKRDPQTVRVDLLSAEVEGRLAEGTTFGYWTFNGKVPGPFIRVRVGDTIDIHLKNSADSSMMHSVDFHAATGPGGGAAVLQAGPGEEKSMTWKALVPGLYVYHCATPMVAEHIANGMYGLILVEPEDGLAPVDREFYVMQGEIYTASPSVSMGARSSALKSSWASTRNISSLMAQLGLSPSSTRFTQMWARLSGFSSAWADQTLRRPFMSLGKFSIRSTSLVAWKARRLKVSKPSPCRREARR